MANDIFADALKKDKTFKEAEGLPANQHAKKIAKQKSGKQKADQVTFFTIKNNKFLKVTVKKNGAYTSYIGNGAKISSSEKTIMIKQWQADDVWVPEHEAEEFAQATIAKLNQ